MKSKVAPAFDASFLNSSDVAYQTVDYERNEVLFSQGDVCEHIIYIQEGSVKVSVRSRPGQQVAVIAMLGPGDFVGEACLAKQPVRIGTAIAMTRTRILRVHQDEMINVLNKQAALSNRFLRYVLARNTRIEQDLIDQLLNPSEKRLARALLLLAHLGNRAASKRVVPHITQQTLAEMVGTTRPRISFFINKFKKLGFLAVNTDGGLTINQSLQSVLRNDAMTERTSKIAS